MSMSDQSGRLDELECALADEEDAHQETLQMLTAAEARIAELEGERDEVLAICQKHEMGAGTIVDRVARMGIVYEKWRDACHALQADRAALAERIRGIEHPSDVTYHDNKRCWKDALAAAASLVEGAGEETKGDSDHARPE
jgi:hypothetical protein